MLLPYLEKNSVFLFFLFFKIVFRSHVDTALDQAVMGLSRLVGGQAGDPLLLGGSRGDLASPKTGFGRWCV